MNIQLARGLRPRRFPTYVGDDSISTVHLDINSSTSTKFGLAFSELIAGSNSNPDGVFLWSISQSPQGNAQKSHLKKELSASSNIVLHYEIGEKLVQIFRQINLNDPSDLALSIFRSSSSNLAVFVCTKTDPSDVRRAIARMRLAIVDLPEIYLMLCRVPHVILCTGWGSDEDSDLSCDFFGKRAEIDAFYLKLLTLSEA